LVRICHWYGGKKAALSLRFDDSHVTHVTLAIPWLDEYGLAGTFLVNPGSRPYQENVTVWEGPLEERGHEIGDHTMHHRGARTDREADWEIGEAARIIRSSQPAPRLMAFQRGGATKWLQRRPLKGFLAECALFNADEGGGGFVMSCSEQYPSFSPEAFARLLDRAIAESGWMKPHFHVIAESGNLHISPETFRELLDIIAARRADLWSAGISTIHQYERERKGSKLFAHAWGNDVLALQLACEFDERLYQQVLTLEADLPAGVAEASVVDGEGKSVDGSIAKVDGKAVVRFDVPPRDGNYEIQAAGLGSAYRAAVGEIGAPRGHPYLFFNKEDLDTLPGKQSDPVAGVMWEAIRQRAEDWREQERPVGEPRRVRGQATDMRALLFCYAVTGDEALAPAVNRHLQALLEDESWHSANNEMLVTAAAVCTLGLAYDWLPALMSDEQKARVRRTIIEEGIRPMLEATEQGEWWTHWSRGNWGEVIYSQMGVAALALLGEVPEAADWVRLCQRKVWHYTEAIGENGGWGESGSYALYGWSNGMVFLDALQRVTGLNLLDSPELAALPAWFTNLLEPDEGNFVPFSNCGPWTEAMPSVLYRVAREHRDGYAQAVAVRKTGRQKQADVFGFLWYDPSVAPKSLSDWPRAQVFSGIDWAMLRSRWEDPGATLFALKAGRKDWDHFHHDTNSFVLYALGRPLIVDLPYPYKIWGCDTEAHNTIMVNGKGQRGEARVAGCRGNPDHRGVIADLLDAPWYARLVGDASMAYDEDDVRSFIREVLYLRQASEADPPDYFVLLDDVETTKASRIDWLLHTYGELSAEGNALSIRQDEAAVDVTLLSPEGVQFDEERKTLEEAGVPKPFDSAEAVSYVKAHAPESVERGVFLAVLAPRPASVTPALNVSAIRQTNLVGAAIDTGSGRDVALFALGEPRVGFGDVAAAGRSCFVRWSGGRVTGAALHGGFSLAVGGMVLFETGNCGQAALRFGEDATEASLDLYNSDWVAIHVSRAPSRVIVDGKERDFQYDVNRRCVRIECANPRSISIALE
jgi:hypothetical protein